MAYRQDKRGTREADEKRSMVNRKPYRTAAQKAEARRKAERCRDGAWRSSAPVNVRHGD